MTYPLAFVVAFGVFAPNASAHTNSSAHPNDLAATRSYLQAEYKLYSAIDANLPISREDLKSYVGEVVTGCPNVLAGFSRKDIPLPNLLLEELTALSAVAESPDVHVELVFKRSVSRLHWTNSALRHLIHIQDTAHEPKISAASLCSDYTTWAASGYSNISEHAQGVLRTIKAHEKRNEVEGPKGSEGAGKAINRLLAPYERSAVRRLAKRVSALQTRLGIAALKLILNAAVEMNEDLGLPPPQNSATA